MKIVYHPSSAEYRFPGHPESPERVLRSCELLSQSYQIVEPELQPEALLLKVHTRSLLEKLKSGEFIDLDTPASPEMFSYALLSASSAVHAARISERENAFSLSRPPGHHAGRDFSGGFCYLNNIAIAVRTLGKKTAILDLDGHWGNGTQDIFARDPKVIYVSLNQAGSYPGEPWHAENCFNFQVPPGSPGKLYLKILERALGIIRQFQPELLAVSAGFDTYKEDPLLQLGLEIRDYERISKMLSDLNLPLFAVLEGGYSEKLPECIRAFLEKL